MIQLATYVQVTWWCMECNQLGLRQPFGLASSAKAHECRTSSDQK